MSENAFVNQIFPGLCPSEGCPSFDRVECIIVPKVYDSCFQTVELTRSTTIELCCFANDVWPTVNNAFEVNTPPTEGISPILECGGRIRNNVDGTYTAFWGYNNRNNRTVTVPQGDSFFTGNPIGSTTVPINTFFPGRHECVFETRFTGQQLVWTLKSPNNSTRTATAGAGTAIYSFKGPFELGDIIPCSLDKTTGISCQVVNRQSAGGGFFTLTLLVSVPIILTNPNDPSEKVQRIFTFIRTVTLCCPENVIPDCSESSIITCNCMVTSLGNSPPIEVTCEIVVCLVVKCILDVQLLVPSYGFCVPAPCITLPGVCPPLPPAQCF